MSKLVLRPTHKVVTEYYDSRGDFAKSLDPFYVAIENAAAAITDFHEKQTFPKTERFIHGFCVKVADTHGIVHTPPSISGRQTMSVVHLRRMCDLLLLRLLAGQIALNGKET